VGPPLELGLPELARYQNRELDIAPLDAGAEAEESAQSQQALTELRAADPDVERPADVTVHRSDRSVGHHLIEGFLLGRRELGVLLSFQAGHESLLRPV